MTENPSEAVIRVWARLMKAQRLTLASVERAGHEGLRPFELERAMLLAQYNLSRLVDRIERAGFVERRACEDDGRGQLVAITERGKAVRRKMWPIYAQAVEATIRKRLSAKQAETLDSLLNLLIAGHRGD